MEIIYQSDHILSIALTNYLDRKGH